MSVSRMVNSKFWSDSFIVDNLNPLDRYLFLYFLTNEKTNLAGVYELPIRTIANETGIDKEEIFRMLERMKTRIEYKDGWVFLCNFVKHQNLNNPKIVKGIENEMDKVPENIMLWINSVKENASNIPVIDNLCITNDNIIKSNIIKSNIIKSNIIKSKSAEVGYSEDFELFWKEYPEKMGKGKAYDSWKKLSPTEKEKSMVQLKLQVENNHFRNKSGIDYIPHPTTWLNQKRWEDEVKVEKKLDIIKFDKYGNVTK